MNYPHPFAFGGAFLLVIFVLIFWTIIWKGLSLWHAARNHQTAWFVVLLIVNTLGILEIIYLAFFRKDHNTVTTTSTPAAETPSAPVNQ